MNKFMDVAKGGWHPEKSRTNSGSSGGQSDSKLGQVKGWVGKAQGKDAHADAAREHQSAPLSSLKDPSSFAPPPRRVDYHGASAASASTPSPAGLSSAPTGSARQRLQEKEEARRREEEEANKPAPGPYRPDATGLSTAHLPKPPAFRPGAAAPNPTGAASRPKPSLPPRLPPRQNSNPDEFAPPPPPTYNEATQQGAPAQGELNQGALGRLGQAGVSVPGFGIGRTASPPVPARMNELQSRFASMSGPKSPAATPTAGTSWADKQAALRTASSLREDPSKVSASDLKGAASTANNFQQRHGEQAASGWKSANSLNQKYGITGRVNNFASSGASSTPAPLSAQSSQGGLGKKAPPPPPPKKKELSDKSGEPPPIPLGSKPKF
ncbi:hypothetical protein BDW02DRAFT_40426 [Decorospora gaudefroyi]|uniref:GMP synthase n=1 Tax=Decorospora gaudefroyi TaxID=184978 RepID=A0A6A5K381_9PLEO|nr:hypothetical protein BDW02DRAFT_40426 [Decorospora gaudefroyi]